ncbi:MAG: cation transporter [Ignavibacteria bacterium]|jgi:cation diffusion facilitator family transporter|nr:cation transporter [Ignavibacteria bacterium]MCU7504554.1 cation transporter [Ignavibacteria bacterium]MCU7516608.1 cation transporter [Ignavibacteria bacterium]
MSKKTESPVAVYGALVANLIIAAAKLTAATFTRSSAMLSEAIHSFVDTGNEVFLLLGIHKSKKPPDELHPFGHGKELYFYSLVVAVLIFGIGGGMSFYEGIKHINEPVEIRDPLWNYIVIAVAFVSESISFLIALREFLKEKGKRSFVNALLTSKNPTNYTVLLEDAAAIAGLIIAALGIYLGHTLNNPNLDAVASLLIGAVLTIVAFFLAFESKQLLIGESAEREVVQKIKEITDDDPSVRYTDKILTMHIGPDEVLLNMEIQFSKDVLLTELPDVISRLEDKITSCYPEIKQIFIEAGSIKKQKF